MVLFTNYLSADDNLIKEKEVLRYLGSMKNNVVTLDEHIEKVCKTLKQKILRTFRCLQPHIMKLLWKHSFNCISTNVLSYICL